MPISKAVQLIKGGSSKWIHETFPEHRLFSWQEKYGAFSVSVSLLDDVIEYIRNQEKHHHKMTFQEEFRELLRRHGIEWNEIYVWDWVTKIPALQAGGFNVYSGPRALPWA